MQQIFTIKPFYNPTGKHNHMHNMGYPQSHPYLYHAYNNMGRTVYLLSKRGDYQDNARIHIDATQIGNSAYYLDNSPALNNGFNWMNQAQTTGPKSGDVNSDVIVMVDTVGQKNGLTEVSGEVFYFDPALKDLPAGTLRDTFKDKAKITVLSAVKAYNFYAGHTYIFEKLKNVTASNGKISAKDGLHPGP